MSWEKKKLLIWGTTYPEFSKTYYETVCTGAVDADTGRLIRLYPVALRYMKEPFRHYQWIEAEVQRNPRDPRPESFRVQQEEIQLGDRIEPAGGWCERSSWMLRSSNVFPSVEGLLQSQARDGTSLGLVRPAAIRRVYVKKLPDSERHVWDAQREQALRQKDLFVDAEAKTKELVFMPVRYRVEFSCCGPECKGHDMSVLDWGTYVLSRRQYARKGRQKAESDVITCIRKTLEPEKKDAYLILGNTLAHPQSFMIVGFYYPPLKKAVSAGAIVAPRQQGLPGIE